MIKIANSDFRILVSPSVVQICVCMIDAYKTFEGYILMRLVNYCELDSIGKSDRVNLCERYSPSFLLSFYASLR